jgi:hypothetical protein
MPSQANAAALGLREEGRVTVSIKLFEEQWTALARSHDAQPPSLFMLVDSAQDERLPQAIAQAVPGTQSKCLLTYAHGPDLEKAAPHLVTMPPFDAGKAFWHAVFDSGAANPPSQSLIASSLDFDALHAHLQSYIEIVMPDDDEMILAFWDPAILGTLVGQEDDTTLHVPGPVLMASQRSHLLEATAGWWYWGRQGNLHQIRPPERPSTQIAPPLKLTQVQVDALIEASVPDHLMSHIHTTMPQLFVHVPRIEQYGRIERHLLEARKLGLQGMKDLLDYIAAALVYGEQMVLSPAIRNLLMKVKMKEISISAAVRMFP